MSSGNRNTRSSLRRKMVLPVTIIRTNTQQRELAHTLDLTEISARLGGLTSVLEPGEIIEIQRGAVKAKFQVFWMGAPGSAMEGQAGVRSVDPGKSIWGINMPADESDHAADHHASRKQMPAMGNDIRTNENRWHTRFECSGGASVRAQGSGFPVHGQVRDIARGGVYLETTTPLTLNAEVYVKMNVEGIPIEAPGVVRTSYPMVGMGISFQNISGDNQDRVDEVIRKIRDRVPAQKNPAETALISGADLPELVGNRVPLNAYPVRVLATACRMLAADFDEWKTERSSMELNELRLAIAELQQKLTPAPLEIVENLSLAPATHGGHV
jgi:PilZ domain